MPQIINPYKSGSGMGDDLFGIGGLADTFFGPKASQSAYTREKFKEQQRQNVSTEELATLLQNPATDPGTLASAATRAGIDPKNVFGMRSGANIARMDPNTLDTPASQALITQNLLTQPGANYVSTPQGQASAQTNQQAIAAAQAEKAAQTQLAIDARTVIPVVDPLTGKTTYAQRSQAIGQGAPITFDQARGAILQANKGNLGALDPYAQNVISADPRMSNWFLRDPGTGKILSEGRTLDGKTDVATGQPLHPNAVTQQSSNPGGANAFTGPATELGKTEQRDRREAINNADQVLNLGGKINEIIARNPTAIGAVGNLKLAGQEVADLVNSLDQQFGGGRPGGYDSAVAQARNQLRAKLGAGAAQLMPELFDSDLNSVRTMNAMLLYKAAAALGQSGRDASDKDIVMVKGMVGDPSSWFQGPTTYKDKIGTLMKIIGQQRDDDFKMLQPGAALQPRAGAVPAAAAPADPAVIDSLVNKYRT